MPLGFQVRAVGYGNSGLVVLRNHVLDLVEYRRIVDGCGDVIRLTVDDGAQRRPQDLAGPRLRQPLDDIRALEGRDRADLLTDQRDDLVNDIAM